MDALDLNLNHLRHFHVVATEGSLKAAGARLAVAPSTLSEQMRLLEEALGQELFDRSGGRLRLNNAGRRLFKRTAVLLDTVRDLLHDFDFERRLERPVVAIGVSSSVSNAFTADYFLPLLERQDLHVVIRHGDHDGLLHQLLMRELDLLLSEHSPVEARAKGLEVRTVDRPALVAVATPPLARRMSGEWPACLEGMPYLTYTAHSAYREHVDGFLDEHRVVGHVVAEVDDLGVLRASAARGIGAAFLPAPVLPSLDEELVEIGRFPEVPDGVTAIYRHYEPPQPVMEAIVQLLEQVEARAKATASSSIE